MCSGALPLEEELRLYLSPHRGGGAGPGPGSAAGGGGRGEGGDGEVPASVLGAWNFLRDGLPGDRRQYAKVAEAVPKSLHRLGTHDSAEPLPGEPVEAWAVELLRADLRRVQGGLPAYPSDAFVGRGVVSTGGSVKYWSGALVAFASLRRQGCWLPGELWVMPEEVDELPPPVRAALEGLLGVRVRLLPANPDPRDGSAWGLAGNFATKAASVLMSGFQEVLFLDADNVPLGNICGLFDTREYRETGTMFWRDYWQPSPAPELLHVANVSRGLNVTHESGQMLVDKARGWRPLLLAGYLNLLGPGVYFKLLNDAVGEGDKESFAFSYLMEGVSHYTIPHPPTPVGAVGPKGDFVGYAIGQSGPGGELALLHQNHFKSTFFNMLERLGGEGLRPKFESHRERVNALAGYDVELWVWKVLRAARCDAAVIAAVQAASTARKWRDQRWCRFWRFYMHDVPSKDSLVCSNW